MWIETLKLQAIRAYAHGTARFPEGVCVLHGPNGSGKTTILEGVALLATLKSFRTGRLSEMIRTGESLALVRADLHSPDTELAIDLGPRRRTLHRDGEPSRNAVGFLGDLRAVVLAPEHQTIVTGSSDERRKFLDRIQFALDPLYLETTQKYARALRQKQALLRQELAYGAYRDQAGVWNDELAKFGERIRELRVLLVDALTPVVTEHHETMAAKGETLALEYISPHQSMLIEFEERGYAEYAAKRTFVGPHRDDLKITLKGRPAEEIASQGERATILLALKLAELSFVEGKTGLRPILLLDDLGATLDAARRNALLKTISKRKNQALVTTADDEVWKAASREGARGLSKETEKMEGGFSIAHWVSK